MVIGTSAIIENPNSQPETEDSKKDPSHNRLIECYYPTLAHLYRGWLWLRELVTFLDYDGVKKRSYQQYFQHTARVHFPIKSIL